MIHIRKSNPSDTLALTAIWRASVLATHDFLSREDSLKSKSWSVSNICRM